MHKVKFGISVLIIRFIVIRLLLSNTVVFHKNSLFLKRLEAITGTHSALIRFPRKPRRCLRRS